MRTIAEIQAEIITAKNANAKLAQLNSTSQVAEWRLWTYVVAVAIWTLNKLFDTHQSDIAIVLSEQLPHTLNWYKNKALKFQYGHQLADGSDIYDNTGIDSSEVISATIVTKSAAVESMIDGFPVVQIKVVKGVDTLSKLSGEELSAFNSYMHEIKDAGVRLVSISKDADKLSLTGIVTYDPLLMNADGMLITGGLNSVQTALNSYLNNLSFDGSVDTYGIINAINGALGVVLFELNNASLQVGDSATTHISGVVKSSAGWVKIGTLNLTYVEG